MTDLNRELLQELLWAYGPCGQEDAVRDVCRRELESLVDDLWVDDAGNLVGLIRADRGPVHHPGVRVMAHLDELSTIVKRVDPDGTLHLSALGTMYPGNFGLGPVAVLGDKQTLVGVLTVGSEHTTTESPRIRDTKPGQGDKGLELSHLYVFTACSPDDLAHAGIGPGTRVCIERSKRTLTDIHGYLGSYFLDDRAPVAALLHTAQLFADRGVRPAQDTYLVFSTNEEIGGVGAAYANRTLPGDLTLALEVGPTETEYATTVHGGPIIGYSDAQCVYDKDVADRLMDIAAGLGLSPQAAVLGAFESDASHAKSTGLTPRAGLLCVPTLSTHGYEVIAPDAIPQMAEVVAEFLLSPTA